MHPQLTNSRLKIFREAGILEHTCNLSIQEVEDHEIKGRLGYIPRLCQKKFKKPATIQ
jgi:hypothetical protein